MLFQYDFYYYYAMGRIALRGENIYSQALLQDEMAALGWGADYVFGAGYPPWAATFLLPFAALPFPLAKLLWFGLSILVVVLCLRAFMPLAGFKDDNSKRPRVLLYWLFCATFFPIAETLMYGQFGWLQLLGVSTFILGRSAGKQKYEGLGLALTISKAHLLLPLYAFVGVESLCRRRFGVIFWGVVIAALQVLASFVLLPGAWSNYMANMNMFSGEARTLLSPTIAQIYVVMFGGLTDLRWAVVTLACLFALFMACSKSLKQGEDSQNTKLHAVVFLLLPLSLLAAPYAWGHDLIVLCIPYVIIFARLSVRHRYLAVMLSLCFLCAYLQLCDRSALEMYKVGVPILFLIAAATASPMLSSLVLGSARLKA